MKIFFSIVGVIILFGSLIFSIQAFKYGSFMFWGPKYEDVRRDIFENTKSYKHGTIRDLYNLKLEYETSDNEAHKAAIASTIRHRVAAYPREELPYELRQFISNL